VFSVLTGWNNKEMFKAAFLLFHFFKIDPKLRTIWVFLLVFFNYCTYFPYATATPGSSRCKFLNISDCESPRT